MFSGLSLGLRFPHHIGWITGNSGETPAITAMITLEDLSLAEHPFRGVKRSAGGVLAMLLIIAVAWSIWAGLAHRRLQARIDSTASFHRPISTARFETDLPVSRGILDFEWKPWVLDMPQTPPAGAAREKIVATIRRLIDTADIEQRNISMVDDQRERDCANLVEQRGRCWLLAPMVDLAESFLLEQRAVDRLAAAAPSVPALRVILQSHPTAMTRQFECPNSRDPVLGVYTNSFETMEESLTQHWDDVADQRAEALAMAIRLYRADHNRWPSQTTDLIPQYLPSVPQDPLMGEPIGYVVFKHAFPNRGPDGNDRPMLFFNLPTDLATAKPPEYPVYSWNDSSAQWRDLINWGPEKNGFVTVGMTPVR